MTAGLSAAFFGAAPEAGATFCFQKFGSALIQASETKLIRELNTIELVSWIRWPRPTIL